MLILVRIAIEAQLYMCDSSKHHRLSLVYSHRDFLRQRYVCYVHHA
jgi:hypothetical protein